MRNANTEYERQAIRQSSPEELIAKLYEMAVLSCYREDGEKAKRIFDTLIRSLNFDYEISGSLYQLYDYCKRLIDEQRFEEVREVIEPIREAWTEGVLQNKSDAAGSFDSARTESRGFLV